MIKLFEDYKYIAFFTEKPLDIDIVFNELKVKKRIFNYPVKQVYRLKQIHSNKVIPVFLSENRVGDGIYDREPGNVLITSHADCLPIYILGENDYALLHVGRMGVYLNIISEAFRYLKGVYKAIIGPGICGECYEVSADIFSDFSIKFPDSVNIRNGRFYIDLKHIATRQLMDFLSLKDIIINPLCTLEENNLYSYRAGDRYKRNAAILFQK